MFKNLPPKEPASRAVVLASLCSSLMLIFCLFCDRSQVFAQRERQPDPSMQMVRAAAATANLSLAATGCTDGAVCVWELSTGQRHHTFKGDSLDVWAVSFSPDSKTLVSGGFPGNVVTWDVAKGTRKVLLNTPWYSPNPVFSLAFSHDGRILAVGRADDLFLWDLPRGRPLDPFVSPKEATLVSALAYSFDDKTLAMATMGREDGSLVRSVRLWDVTTWKERATFRGHTRQITTIALSRDGKRLASGSDDKTVRIWNAESGQPLFTLQRHRLAVTSVAMSPDGKTVASAGLDELVLWDVETGRLLVAIEEPGGFRTVGFSEDGKTLAVTFQEGDNPPVKWSVADLLRPQIID